MPTIADRLNEALAEKAGANQSALAKACKVSRASVSDWLHGRIKSLSPPNLVSAADFLSVEIRWLAIGEGPKRLQYGEQLSLAAQSLLDSIRVACSTGTPDSVFIQLQNMLPVVADGTRRVISSYTENAGGKLSRTHGEIAPEQNQQLDSEERKNVSGRRSSTRTRGKSGR